MPHAKAIFATIAASSLNLAPYSCEFTEPGAMALAEP